MAGDERRARLDRPVTLCGMQIGVAHAGRFQLYQCLAVAGGRQVELLDLQWPAEFGDDGGAHVSVVSGAVMAPSIWVISSFRS